MFYPQTYDFKKEHLVFYPKPEMVPSVTHLTVWLRSFFFLKRDKLLMVVLTIAGKAMVLPTTPAFTWEGLALNSYRNPCEYQKCML